MLGLMVKDLRILKCQAKNFFIFAFLAFVMLAFMGGQESYVMGYFSLVAVLLVGNTIAYDEFENGYLFLFTLPVTKKIYCLEKYVLGIIAILLANAIISVLTFIKLGDPAIVYEAVAMVGVVMMMMSIMIPLQLKFGAEKMRLVIMIIGIAVVGISYIVGKILEKTGAMGQLGNVLVTLGNLPPAVLAIVGILVVLAVLSISILVSIKVMEDRQL